MPNRTDHAITFPCCAVTGRLYADTRIYFTFVVFPEGDFLMGDAARHTPDRLRGCG